MLTGRKGVVKDCCWDTTIPAGPLAGVRLLGLGTPSEAVTSLHPSLDSKTLEGDSPNCSVTMLAF